MEENKKFATDWLFPHGIKCIVCDAELREDTRYGLCPDCKLKPIVDYCTVCGREVLPQNTVCDHCKEARPAFDAARSVFSYKDDVCKLVQRFKYNNARYLAPYMAQFMADAYYDSDFSPDLITFVPLHRSRERMRGYNQAKLLAKSLAECLRLPVVALLEKVKKTKNLARLTRAQRVEAIAQSFSVLPDADCKNKSVLLVDDVLTTGATSEECAKVLKCGGAREVVVLTFASVPERPALHASVRLQPLWKKAANIAKKS